MNGRPLVAGQKYKYRFETYVRNIDVTGVMANIEISLEGDSGT